MRYITQEDLQQIWDVMGKDLPVIELVNLSDSTINGHMEHFFETHLVESVSVSKENGLMWAVTRRSCRLLGRLKGAIGGAVKICVSLLSLWIMCICLHTMMNLIESRVVHSDSEILLIFFFGLFSRSVFLSWVLVC